MNIRQVGEDIIVGLYLLLLGLVFCLLSPLWVPALVLGVFARRRGWEWWR